MLFAEGVPNAAAAHLSLATGIKGGCQTIIGSRTSGLDALGLAAARIASGRWDRAIVAAADEYSPMVNAGYAHCGVYAPREPALPFSKARTFVAGWGSAALVLESRESFLERSGRRIWGDVRGYAAGSGAVHDLPRTTNRILAELSDPPAILSSANGTWLDQAEDGAMRRSGEVTGCKPLVSSLCGHIAECFSAAPLAGIVAVLLSGRLPRLFGAAPSDDRDAPVERFASLATDYNGLAAGVCINRQTQGRIDAEVLR
jgi:3-oxoacyl-(acyl-carrier-protein) synthase